ncbi:MAG: murein biosynthesis integral membrane protein MurJ [Candidatus Andersenbacteria bacterium]|nr:murein biosynthesis integral membrane protein MurJ [Candidatus Andersenbacteria bacterium]
MANNELAQTARSASLISLTAAAGAAVGLVLQLLVAYHFGASAKTDAYFMALSTSEMLSKLLLGGSVAAVFLPLFVERIARQGLRAAGQLAFNVLHLAAVIFLIVTALLGLFAEPFVQFIAPGFAPETAQLTILLLRVLLPAFVFLFLVELMTATLQALRQFTYPALTRLISPLVSIIFILLFVKLFDIFALALGVLVGSVMQLIFLTWRMRRCGLKYRFTANPRDPAIRRILTLVYPFLLSVMVTQAAGITYRVLVSNLTPGSLAALKYAEKITQLLTIMFLSSVTAVIYPTLSLKASSHDRDGLRDTIALAIRLITFITVPIIIGVAILREPFIAIVFQRGSFQAADAALTSRALLYLILGLTANGISSVLGHATLALQETRAAVAVTVASHAIALFLFVLLVPPLAHAGLALASSLVPIAIAFLYFLYLTRFIPRLITIFWYQSFLPVCLLGVALSVTVTVVHNFTISLTPSPAVQLAAPALAGILVFFGGAAAWRIPEMNVLSSLVRQSVNKIRP